MKLSDEWEYPTSPVVRAATAIALLVGGGLMFVDILVGDPGRSNVGRLGVIVFVAFGPVAFVAWMVSGVRGQSREYREWVRHGESRLDPTRSSEAPRGQ